uniref:uncharacterized protein LOC113475011 n=1 Tax=Ciona intestinalis TaxID=7719 RepID=UPI000EF51690|nr:uncharacterized protein LOC113475011 [Ciona intestinalis]XP_026694190.1 uncharacterized protein LOC113475011 [Ciona intestinalis]|eukprot:XP_026694189.1 uncharacterized protein LOC113475011 [Ciona intestinalis]
MDSDNNDRKPEWAKWSNAGSQNQAGDEEVSWYSPYEMYVDLDEETKEVSDKFKKMWGRWEKQKVEGDGKNKNVVPEGPYDMYVDLDEGTQEVSEEFKARWRQWKKAEAENNQNNENLPGPSTSFPHTEEGQRARRQHERRRKELFTMWDGRG